MVADFTSLLPFVERIENNLVPVAAKATQESIIGTIQTELNQRRMCLLFEISLGTEVRR